MKTLLSFLNVTTVCPSKHLCRPFVGYTCDATCSNSIQVYSLGAFSGDGRLVGMVVADVQGLSVLEGEIGPILDSVQTVTTSMYILSLGESVRPVTTSVFIDV